MHKRVAFVISVCGMMFVVLPMLTVLRQPDFVTFAIGAGLLLVGIFAAIEAASKPRDRQ